jgi:hypothetical protein
LSHPSVAGRPVSLEGRSGEHDPEAYRLVLGALLEHGELSLGHLRALLDRADAAAMPVGGLVELAVQRGDAVRLDERLVTTGAAVVRRDLAASVPSIVLSDPAYRAYLADAVEAVTDRKAAIRRDAVAAKFKAWDRRLFGRALDTATVSADLDQVLLDRPLGAFTVARADGAAIEPVRAPFLDVWEQPNLRIARPAWLGQLQGGVAAVHALVRRAARQGGVALPDLGDVPVATHAGLYAPGEPGPRVVTDNRSLRLRALEHTPVLSLGAALLLLHRQRPERLAIVEDKAGWGVQVAGKTTPVWDVIDAFAESRGWTALRGPSGGLHPAVWVRVLEVLGLATLVGRQLVLAEPLFARAHGEAEEGQVFARLVPLSHAFEAWLDSADADT